MAKKKASKPVKTAVRRARSLGTVRLLSVEISPQLDDAIDAMAGADRRTRKTVVSMALEEFLAKHGFWPPVESDE